MTLIQLHGHVERERLHGGLVSNLCYPPCVNPIKSRRICAVSNSATSQTHARTHMHRYKQLYIIAEGKSARMSEEKNIERPLAYI